MNLVFVTETFPPEINGVAMTLRQIATELGRRGHAVTVFRPLRNDLPATAPDPTFREIAVPGFPVPGYALIRFGLPARGRFLRAWRESRPDLVHVATEGPLGASAISAARSLGIPVTSSFHTNFHTYTGNYGLPLLRRAVLAWLRRVHNRTACTFAPTQELVNELAGLGFRDLAVLSRGVDTRRFRPERRQAALRARWKAGPNDPVVIHVGRLAAEKNYPLLFCAFDAIRAANPACRFVVVGDGPLRRRLERQQPDVYFPGFIVGVELAQYYASADVYLHPSLTETFGNVLTEAMASGLAVTGFDYAAARQFLRSEVNGLSMPCDQPDQLVAAGVRLATDAPLRRRLGAAARLAVEGQSWEKVITGFESQLEAIANRASVSPVRPHPIRSAA